MGEFADYQNLLRCGLCDTINVIFPDYDTQGQFKIVKTVWNVLTSRYDEMELGSLSTSLSEALGITNNADRTSDTFNNLTVLNDLTVSGDVSIGGDFTVGGSFLAVNSTAIYSSQSVPGNGYVSASSHSLTKPDNTHNWKAIAIAGWSMNQHNVRFSSCYIDGNASVFAGLHNDGSSALSTNVSIYILWMCTP